MKDDRELERRLEDFLARSARPMPPERLAEVIRDLGRSGAGSRATFGSGARWRMAFAALGAVLVVAVAIGAALRLSIGPDSGSTQGLLPSLASPPAPPPTQPSFTASAPTPTPSNLPEWHRNNYNAGEEQLICQESIPAWTCEYRVPDGTGLFSGQNVTSSWTCPDWFPRAICDHVTAVYHGNFVVLPADGQYAASPEIVSQDLVVTEVDGQAVLQLYWVDRFVCPWYRTYEEALAADFNCVMAP